MLDPKDHQIVQSLQHDPRASFSTIGSVLGLSEQTVARRYRRLRADGVLRVMGLVNPVAVGLEQWIVRIRCRPDKTVDLAETLARRPDVAYMTISAGGLEIICLVRSPVDDAQGKPLLEQLPRSNAVLEVSIDLLLHRFGPGGPDDWVGSEHPLTERQVSVLVETSRQSRGAAGPVGGPVQPGPEDQALLAALAEDGRTSYAALAAATGWSEGKVAHRVQALASSGALYFDVDLLPEQFGYGLQADMWIRTSPRHLMEIGQGLGEHDEVLFAGATSGSSNLLALVLCRDAGDLHRYLTTKVAALDGINAYDVSVIARRVKQAGSLIARGRLVHPPVGVSRAARV